MILRLTPANDGGREVATLNVPIPDRAWHLLSPEAIAAEYIIPYLAGFQTDSFILEACSRSGAGVTTRNEFGAV
jgi:hypothetical protein